jgi:predicted nuclease of predicted toxin-antitoxin system
MRFLLDESADQRLIAFLTERGHDATAVALHYPNALPDRQVLALARRERRVLITNDRDFGELIFRERLRHHGVLLFRLRSTNLAVKEARLDFVFRQYRDRLSEFLTVTETRVRPERAEQLASS